MSLVRKDLSYQTAFKNPRTTSIMHYSLPEPTLIDCKGLKFLITERPLRANLENYIQKLKQRNVTTLVRVCQPSYDTEDLMAAGIVVHDLYFKDGTRPSPEIMQEWFKIVQNHYDRTPDTCIAVHCIAGLGRAPVMVAVCLIELGLTPEDVIELIRNNRHGAFNMYQLMFLEHYRPKSRLKLKNGSTTHSCCIQ